MKSIRKLMVVVLAVIMAASMSSCGDTTWIAQDNSGFVVPVGAYTYYAYYTYSMLLGQGMLSKDDDLAKKEISEGKVAQDFINELALDNVKYLIELEQRFNAAGLTISDAQKAAIETENDSEGVMAGTQYANGQVFFEKNGVAKSSVVLASLDGGLAGLKEEMLYNYNYGENGLTPITDEEIATYYKDNYLYVSYISEPIASIGGTSSAVDETIQAEVKERFEGFKTACEGGSKDFEDIVKEYSEKDDTTKYYAMSKQSYSKGSNSSMLTAVSKVNEGEFLYFEEGNRAYLIHRLKAADSKYLENEDNKTNLRMTMKMADFQNEILEAAKANTSITINENAQKKFSIQKLKFS